MKWYFKALIQKSLSMLPWGRHINRFLQERYGELREPDLMEKLRSVESIFINPLIDRFGGLPKIKIVEIGTGWIPVMPIALGLMGAECKTFDVVRHLDKEKVINALIGTAGKIGELYGENGFSAKIKDKSTLQTMEIEDILQTVGVEYIAPVDTRKLPVEDNSQDATVSNLVLQHIPPQDLRANLLELYRILKPGGLSIHKVNLHDEYAQNDPGVSMINFLIYPGWFWDNFGNNSIKYINRARYPDYIELFEKIGFRVSHLFKKLDDRSLDSLGKMKVAKEFSHYSEEELATVGFNVILEKPTEQEH